MGSRVLRTVGADHQGRMLANLACAKLVPEWDGVAAVEFRRHHADGLAVPQEGGDIGGAEPGALEGVEPDPRRLRVTGGLALELAAAGEDWQAEAQLLHRRLQDRWRPHLTRQDGQPFRPHVTVQNKVTTEVARATLDRLHAGFEPSTARAVGLVLWRYDGGPWTLLRRWALGSAG